MRQVEPSHLPLLTGRRATQKPNRTKPEGKSLFLVPRASETRRASARTSAQDLGCGSVSLYFLPQTSVLLTLFLHNTSKSPHAHDKRQINLLRTEGFQLVKFYY